MIVQENVELYHENGAKIGFSDSGVIGQPKDRTGK